MNEFLEFISISLPTIIISIVNLLILYLILKKFLFGRVEKMLVKRKEEIDGIYNTADLQQTESEEMNSLYKEKLSNIENERLAIVSEAVHTADKQCENIYETTKKDIVRMKKEADKEIELSKEIAYKEAKEDIADISVAIASRILQQEIDPKKHQDIVEEFVNSLEVAK